MFLADIDLIRTSLGFDDMPDITSALESALDAAEEQLGSRLRTSFDQRTITDTFVIPESPNIPHSKRVRTEILLSQGFVQGTPAVVVTNSSSAGVDSAFFISDTPDTSGTSAFTWSSELGSGVDIATNYTDAQLDVTYTAGFAPDISVSPPVAYDLTLVPKWLQDAARLLALLGIADMEIVTQAGIVIDKASTQVQVNLLLGRKVRYRPLAFMPIG